MSDLNIEEFCFNTCFNNNDTVDLGIYSFKKDGKDIYTNLTFKVIPETSEDKARYYFRLNSIPCLGEKPIIYAYMYFYIDDLYSERSSEYIGQKVHPEYRGLGLGHFLMSTWLDFCLSNNILDLKAHSKQRKLCLLKLLKDYGFESLNKDIFQDGRLEKPYMNTYVVDVFQNAIDGDWWFRFKDDRYQQIYLRNKVSKENGYNYLLPGVNPSEEFNFDNWIAVGPKGEYKATDCSVNKDKVYQILNSHPRKY